MGVLLVWLLSFFLIVGLIGLVVYQCVDLYYALSVVLLSLLRAQPGMLSPTYKSSGILRMSAAFTRQLANKQILLLTKGLPGCPPISRCSRPLLIVSCLPSGYNDLMCLADLELDYINPFETAARVNGTLKPEYVIQGVLCLAFLLTGHWLMFLFCLPYLYYNLRQYRQNQHLVDVTEIFNMLSWEKKQRLIKLAYLITLLFVSIFWMIFVVLDED